MCDTPDILNLQLFYGIPISIELCHATLAVEGRGLYEVTHLAYARSQDTGNGTLGIIPKIIGSLTAAFFKSIIFYITK